MPVMYGYDVRKPVCTFADANFLSMLARDDGSEGLLQLCVRYRGVRHEDNDRIDTFAQFEPCKLLDVLNRQLLKKSQVNERFLVYGDTDEDIYCTINTMQPCSDLKQKGHRGAAKCVTLRMLYWDIDAHGGTTRPEQVIDLIVDAIRAGELPPMALVNTGRGCGLYIPIKPESASNIPAQKAYRGVAREVYNRLCRLVEPLQLIDGKVEVDRAVVGDTARIARLPGTANTGNGGTRCHAVDGYAYVNAVDLLALADWLQVDYHYEPPPVVDHYLLWARHVCDMYWGHGKITVTDRAAVCLEWLQQHPPQTGERHKKLMAAGSTLLDGGKAFDNAAFASFADCCVDKLEPGEYNALAECVSKSWHYQSATIERILGMPSGMLATAEATDNTIAYIKIPGRMYRLAVAYRIDHDKDYHGDTRIRNRSRDAARAANKTAKDKAKEKARQLLASGMSVRDVAEKTGLGKSSVQRLKGN